MSAWRVHTAWRCIEAYSALEEYAGPRNDLFFTVQREINSGVRCRVCGIRFGYDVERVDGKDWCVGCEWTRAKAQGTVASMNEVAILREAIQRARLALTKTKKVL